MAFTTRFVSSGPVCPAEDLEAWLKSMGEPCERNGEGVQLRALPISFVCGDNSLTAQLSVNPMVPLTRLVDVLFSLSMHLGADVVLVGTGTVKRSSLWTRLADEQDRLRIAEALQTAVEHGNSDLVCKRLWAVLSELRENHDDRWDAPSQRIVEMLVVGESITAEVAAWHAESPQPGDQVGVPVESTLHIIVWRWLAEAYPGLAETTLH